MSIARSHSMRSPVFVLLFSATAPVFGARMNSSNWMALGGIDPDPDPPWRKGKLCYSTLDVAEEHVCGSKFKEYNKKAKSDKTYLTAAYLKDRKAYRVGARVLAKHKGVWYEGVVVKVPGKDPKHQGMWCIQPDVDPPGTCLYVHDVHPTADEVLTLGFLDLKGKETYVADLASNSRSKSERLLDAVLGGAKKALGEVVGLFVPFGGVMTELLVDTIKAIVLPDTNPAKVDLTPLFEKFEKRMELHNFGKVLGEIQSTYNIFLRWMQDLLDPDFAPTELRYEERSVSMIEAQLDIARVLFSGMGHADSGLESYYLFEPLLQQAVLHQVVMLMHISKFKQLGEHQEALVHLGRAKRNYDEYRHQLAGMQSKLLKWRLAQVTFGGTSIDDVQDSTWRKGKALCKEKWTSESEWGLASDEVAVTYRWADKFEKSGGIPTVRQERSFSITRNHKAKILSTDSCIWEGTWTDGRGMLEEPYEYAKVLSKQLLRHTDGLLAVLDAIWLKLPGEECLDGLTLHRSEELAEYSCQRVEDATLPRRLKENFGSLRQSGVWPGQQPVLVAERYVLCRKSKSPTPIATGGNVCVKFL